jgi:hypothetical protein
MGDSRLGYCKIRQNCQTPCAVLVMGSGELCQAVMPGRHSAPCTRHQCPAAHLGPMVEGLVAWGELGEGRGEGGRGAEGGWAVGWVAVVGWAAVVVVRALAP